MKQFEITLVKSKLKAKPYCKVDGSFAGPTWKNDIGLHSVEYDIQSVYEMCAKLSEAPEVCMVYGHAIKPQIINTDRTMANFREEPTYLLTLDLDNYEGGFKDEFPTYTDAIKESDRFINDFLPPEFHSVSYVLRFSSSFLAKDTKLKIHIMFLLSASQYPREIGTWIKKESIPADPTFYFNLTQPIFTAAPIFRDTINPLARIDGRFPRVSLVTKELGLVPEGWQPYVVPERKRTDLSDIPNATELPGKVGSFCRNMSIGQALSDLGYEMQDDGRFLSPNSQSGLPGAIVFENGYCYTHHSDDPISMVADKMFGGKRSSFNSYDLMYGWARINQEDDPGLMTNFEFILSESLMSDQEFQEEILKDFVFRTEWIIEDGYTANNKLIIDSLMFDMSRNSLNEMSRNYILGLINVKSDKKISLKDLKNTWKFMKKDSAFYKNEYDPDAGLRNMARIFTSKSIVYSHHGGLRGDFWCYYKKTRMWKRLNRDQTDGFVYKHLHEALPIKKEIELYKVEQLTKLILRLICEGEALFKPGPGWAFKGGKVGILMRGLFSSKPWTLTDSIVTLKRDYKIAKELPITYDEWKQASPMPSQFNDFLVTSFEEDYSKIDLVREYIGYIFADSYFLHNYLILEGVPGSGKSMLVKILQACLSEKMFTTLSLNKIGSPFALGNLPGKKLAVISEAREIDFNKMRAAIPVILKLVGNDPMDVEAKHKMAITETLDAKLIFVTNRTPVMPDDTGALTQRMIMVRLHKSFRGTKEEILGLDDLILATEKPSIIKWALVALEQLSKRRKFVIPDSVVEESVYYREQLDPLTTFLSEFFIMKEGDEFKDEWIESSRLTTHYQEYLFSIGQSVPKTTVQKRVAINVLKNMDKRIEKRAMRNGTATLKRVSPLVPKEDLNSYFIAERTEIEALGIDEKKKKEKK